MALSREKGRFITLLRIGTGLSFRTVYTWVTLENGPDDNPLNIGPGNHYGNGSKAAIASIALLRGPNAHTFGYDSIVGSAGKKDSEQLKAIALSAWNGGPLASAEVHMEYASRLQNTYNSLFPSGKISFSLGDITVKNPLTQIDDAAGLAAGGAGSLLGAIGDSKTWIRILMVILGAIALIGGLVLFTKELGGRK
jgi:hypothetical protein